MMAGRGQHFIPQHYQKPFVYSEEKDQILMYRRGAKKALPVSRGDAAKERDFYSSPSGDGTKTLDDIITEYESKIFSIVDEIRAIQVGSSVSSEKCAELVAHFFSRTQHLRKSIGHIWSGLAKIIYDIAENPEKILRDKRLPAHRAPKTIEESLKEKISSNGFDKFTGVNAETLSRIVYLGIRENLEQITAEARQAISEAFVKLDDNSVKLIRDAHQRMLRSSLAPEGQIKRFSELQWKIIAHEHASAIIADCLCIACSSSGDWKALPFAEDLTAVILPLTPHSLLLGTKEGAPVFAVENYNSAAAAACFEFFLSNSEIDINSLVADEIGQAIRNDIDNLVSNKALAAIDEYLSAPSHVEEQRRGEHTPPEKNNKISYNVKLYDFGDMEHVEKIANKINYITTRDEFAENLDQLDGFTFAINYEEAANSLDRGFTANSRFSSEGAAGAIGVAIPLTVKRGDHLKTHFILRSFLAEGLLKDDDDTDRKDSEQTILYLLSGLKLDKIERHRFSGWMQQGVVDPIDNYFYQDAGGLFSTYFCSRNSIGDSDDTDYYLDNFLNRLPIAISECIEERKNYRTGNDLDALIEIVRSNSKEILTMISRIIGKQSAIEQDESVPQRLLSALNEIGMGDWLKLFSRDMSSFFERIDKWRNFEEKFFLNRHMERWFLFFGIIVQPLDDGRFYVHVPLGSDREYLESLSLYQQ